MTVDGPAGGYRNVPSSNLGREILLVEVERGEGSLLGDAGFAAASHTIVESAGGALAVPLPALVGAAVPSRISAAATPCFRTLTPSAYGTSGASS